MKRLRYISLLIGLLCSALTFANEKLIEQVQGFILLGNPHPKTAYSLNQPGFQFIEIEIPGGNLSLQNKLEKYLNQALSTSDLQQIKREIILAYRNHKHPLVSVYIPEQPITHGVVQFIVQESRVNEVIVYGNRYFSTQQYTQAIQLAPGEPIDEQMLLNNLNFINRNPYRNADLVYAPGNLPYTTDIELFVTDQLPLSVYAGVDNTGLVHTDRTRWFMGCTWANAFGLDHIFSFQYTAAPNYHKFNAFTVSYTIPLPIQHILLLYGGYSQVNLHLPESSKTHGSSAQGSLRYTIPLPTAPRFLHEVSCGFDLKRSNNTVELVENFPVIGQEVNLTQFTVGYNLGYQRDFQQWSHKVGWDIELFFSPFTWLPEQSTHDFQTLNPVAIPTYVYGRSALNYKMLLPKGFQWTTLVEMQLSNQSLLPSEQKGLGGYNTVRGYEERQLNADDGLLVSTALHFPKWHFLKNRGKHQITDSFEFLLFFDYGLAHDNKKLAGVARTDYLMGAGPGLRYAIENYLSARLDWGIKLHKDHFPGGSSMLHFSVVGSF